MKQTRKILRDLWLLYGPSHVKTVKENPRSITAEEREQIPVYSRDYVDEIVEAWQEVEEIERKLETARRSEANMLDYELKRRGK